jgi:hypothetical protein
MESTASQILTGESAKGAARADEIKGAAGRAIRARESISARAVEILRAAHGNALRSIVLTGSLARDEGTFVPHSQGLELLGDADFLVVFSAGSQMPAVAEDASLSRKIEEILLKDGLRCTVHAHAVSPQYFQALPRAIFSYELRKCGRIVWGDPGILELIPDFSLADLSHEDAWRMLCNRMIEQLAFVHRLAADSADLLPDLHYATVKLFLDMATSYLVFAGQYAPSYQTRAQRLQRVAADSPANAPFPLAKFAARVSDCTMWKLTGEDEYRESSIELWKEAISYMRRLWRWQMMQLAGKTGVLTVAELSRALAQRQTAKQRLRGWASVVKRRGGLKSAVHWPRWARMAFHATPRYLVYHAATEVAFRLPCLVKHSGQPPRLDVDWDELRALLPERAPQSQYTDKELWRKLVDDVLWNYSQFLEGTTA